MEYFQHVLSFLTANYSNFVTAYKTIKGARLLAKGEYAEFWNNLSWNLIFLNI